MDDILEYANFSPNAFKAVFELPSDARWLVQLPDGELQRDSPLYMYADTRYGNVFVASHDRQLGVTHDAPHFERIWPPSFDVAALGLLGSVASSDGERSLGTASDGSVASGSSGGRGMRRSASQHLASLTLATSTSLGIAGANDGRRRRSDNKKRRRRTASDIPTAEEILGARASNMTKHKTQRTAEDHARAYAVVANAAASGPNSIIEKNKKSAKRSRSFSLSKVVKRVSARFSRSGSVSSTSDEPSTTATTRASPLNTSSSKRALRPQRRSLESIQGTRSGGSRAAASAVLVRKMERSRSVGSISVTVTRKQQT